MGGILRNVLRNDLRGLDGLGVGKGGRDGRGLLLPLVLHEHHLLVLGLDLDGGPACADTREREREMVGFMRYMYNYIIRSMLYSFAIRPKYKMELRIWIPPHRIVSRPFVFGL